MHARNIKKYFKISDSGILETVYGLSVFKTLEFIHSFNRYLLNTNFLPSTALKAEIQWQG